MKRYRLIKKYPRLPSDWEEGMEIGHGDRSPYDYYSPCIAKYTDYHVLPSEIKMTEFWEEIIEKDYEIITFGFKGGFDRTLDKYGKYSISIDEDNEGVDGKDGNTIIDLIETTNYYIKSVKRLSDGEIFTIGDVCNPVGTQYKYNKKPITRIWFTSDNSLRISSKNYTLDINGIEHSKKPLFTTEDDVDIYINDSFYYIGDAWNICETQMLYKGDGDFVKINVKIKTFSTKEKAEEYILWNKPCLSYIDIIKYFNVHHSKDTFTASRTELKKLVKSRL